MRNSTKSKLEMVLFTLPAIILVTMMIYIPFVSARYYSLTEWNGISSSATFVGLENFKTILLKSSQFTDVLAFTGKYTVLFMLFSNVLALGLAVLLVQKLKTATSSGSLLCTLYHEYDHCRFYLEVHFSSGFLGCISSQTGDSSTGVGWVMLTSPFIL